MCARTHTSPPYHGVIVPVLVAGEDQKPDPVLVMELNLVSLYDKVA